MNGLSQKPKGKLESGFTLIELLVVIIIIGILAGVAIIGVSGARNTAQKAACKADATQIIKGLRAYSAANNLQFPGGNTARSFSYANMELLWNGDSKFIENPIVAYAGSGSTTSQYVLTATLDADQNLTVVGNDRVSGTEFQEDCTVTG